MLEQALALAARGWAVFPVRVGQKIPACKNGFHDATRDHAQIRKWWGRNARYNIGVATGPASGMWALDVDPKDGGNASLAELESAHGPLPVTLKQKTGRGGSHYLFAWTEGVRNRGRFAPGLDVRGDGGYILVAPSELEGAGAYGWLTEAPICAAPAWLIGIVIKHSEPSEASQERRGPYERPTASGRASPYGDKVLIGECHTIASCAPGAQDETLIRRATRVGSFVGGGEIDEGYAFSALVEAGLAMSNGDARDPWTRRVIEAKVRRGLEYGMRDPNRAPPRPERAGRPQLRVVGSNEKVDEDGVVTEQETSGLGAGYPPWMVDIPGWSFNDEGKLKPASLKNAKLMVEHSPATKGMFQYNAFSDAFVVTRGLPGDARQEYPREIKDHDEVAVAAWMNGIGLFPSISNTSAVIREVASRNSIDPLRAYFDGLRWDGKPRITGWLTYYLGVEKSDYADFVGRLFLISAVARALRPGCKVDTMLILEGAQGLRKSSAVRALAGDDFFADQIGDITSKESSQLIQGRWVIEVPEMDKFSRHEANAVKDYLARQEDRYRPPYGRNVVTRPRRCVFVGTINPVDDYQPDPTGARRFWPVACTAIDLDAIRCDRDQIWAEAKAALETNERYWVEDEEVDTVRPEQEARMSADVWEPKIMGWLRELRARGSDMFTLNELLSGAVGMETSRQGQREKLRVASTLTKLGCGRTHIGRGADKTRGWTIGDFK